MQWSCLYIVYECKVLKQAHAYAVQLITIDQEKDLVLKFPMR